MNTRHAAFGVVLSRALISAAKDWVRFAKKMGPPVLIASALAAFEVGAGSATVLVDEIDAGILQGTADT